MSCDYDFVAGDTNSLLRVTCKDKQDQVIDLTGATVTLKWKNESGALQQKTMAINPPSSAGIVQYQFAANELFAPSMYFTVKIEDSSGGVVHDNCGIKTLVREAQ